MLNQLVSIDDIDRAEPASTALLPLPSRNGLCAVDADLKARLVRAAAASALSTPDVISSAAVLLLPLDLPLNTQGKRRAAAPFAIEPFLAADLDSMHIVVGPALQETVHLCAAANRNALENLMEPTDGTGVVLPDLCAVPLPKQPAGWGIWCADHATYIRTFDGGGMVVAPDNFSDLWQNYGRPSVELWHGTPPSSVNVTRRCEDIPEVDASVFELNMRPNKKFARGRWAGRMRYAALLSAVAAVAHAAILFTDARALEDAAAVGRADAIAYALDRGVTLDFDLPIQVLTADLESRAHPEKSADPFLALLARVGKALSDAGGINFRDMRFDGGAGTLAILISASDLEALQDIEAALRAQGMNVAGGAASTGASGAEMQLVVMETR